MSDLVHVKGLADLQKFLDQLPAKLEANILRSALRAGANVIKEEVKVQLASNGSVDTGLLRDGIKVGTRLKQGTVTANVKMAGKHGFVANWVEYGTAAHKILPKRKFIMIFAGLFTTNVEHPGARPKPFMRPALDGKAQEALVAVGRAIKKRLTREGLNTADVEIEAE